MRLVKLLLDDIKSSFKNYQVVFLLLIGPIGLTLFFGGAYKNTYVEDIPIAVLDEDNSSMSRMVIQQFSENDRFDVTYYAKTKEELKGIIDSRKVYMGIIVPYNFSKDVNSLQSSEVLIIVDGTNIIIGNNSYAAAAGIIQTIAAGAQIKLIEAKGALPQTARDMALAFNFNDRILYDPRMSYMNYLLLGFIAVFLQQVILSGIGISSIKDGSDAAKQHTAIRLALRVIFCALLALLSTYSAIQIAKNIFGVSIRGSIPEAMLLCSVFITAVSGPAILIAAMVKDRLKFAQICFMLSLPTFVSSGYVWPQEQMPAKLVSLIKIFWPLINFARPFDELLFKGAPLYSMQANVIQMLLYSAFWLPVGIIIFKIRFKDKTLEKAVL